MNWLLAMAACTGPESGKPVETGDSVEWSPPSVVWGDVHSHTNLSHDGCENSSNFCLPDETLPGEDALTHAAANGLGFAAFTDHAEFTGYGRDAEGIQIDVWERTRDLVSAGGGSSAFGVMGFEWTSSCTHQDPPYQQMHRTVLIEDVDACAQWRIPSCHNDGFAKYGAESYLWSDLEPAVQPSDLLARLNGVPSLSGCAASRWISMFHHTAQDTPAPVDWGSAESFVEGDRLVEIASEHGSSECDTTAGVADGCDWYLNPTRHLNSGSIQYMLQQGHQLGFVGGTDNHEGDPGSLANGAGKVRDLDAPGGPNPWHQQYAPGTITGVLSDAESFDRTALFDALEARHTVAASWPATGLLVYAVGTDGARYLPGDDVPAGELSVTVALDDPRVAEWSAEVVDAWGSASPVGALSLAEGEAKYVRVRATIAGGDHRIWASPWFGVE